MKSDKFILYGLSEYENIVDKIINDINCHANYFGIKLILTEAITNTFKHGNNKNEDKPIHLRYEYKNKCVKLD